MLKRITGAKVVDQAAALAIGLLVAGICQLHVSGSLAEDKAVSTKVGVILPLSGPLALIGEALQRAVKMADEDFDPEHKVDFVFEDDQYQPKNAVTSVQKLIAVDHIKGLFVFGSPSSSAVADLAEHNQISMVSISTATTVSNGRKFIVRHWVNAEDEALALVEEGTRRKYESAAMLTTHSDGFIAVRDEYVKISPLKIVRNEDVDPAERDFRTEALKIRALNPSAVFLLLAPPQASILGKQLRVLGYKGEFFSIHTFESEEEVRSLHPALVGSWYVLGDERPAVAFHEKYRSRYGTDPVAGAVNGYDIAKLFIEGIYRGDLNNYLHEVKDFNGALGVYSANHRGGFTLPVAIKEVTTAGLKYLEGAKK